MPSDQGGLADYASPILRASVFRRLYPGAQISYTVVSIEDAFPMGHRDYEGKAMEAVRCEIVFADGTYIVAHKEVDLKDNRNRDIAQTPENLAKDETKALGRALRDAGIPQRLSELKLLMQWYPNATRETSVVNTSSLVRPPLSDSGVQELTNGVANSLAAAFPGSSVENDDDHADAGTEEPTAEQQLARRFAMLDGPSKAALVSYARETLGVGNVLRAGEHVEALNAYLDQPATVAAAVETQQYLNGEEQAVVDAIKERAPARRAQEIEELGNEEPFLSLGEQRDGYRNQAAP